jgi:hypothetical protein
VPEQIYGLLATAFLEEFGKEDGPKFAVYEGRSMARWLDGSMARCLKQNGTPLATQQRPLCKASSMYSFSLGRHHSSTGLGGTRANNSAPRKPTESGQSDQFNVIQYM